MQAKCRDLCMDKCDSKCHMVEPNKGQLGTGIPQVGTILPTQDGYTKGLVEGHAWA